MLPKSHPSVDFGSIALASAPKTMPSSIWVYGKGAQLWAEIIEIIQGTDYSLLAKPDLRTSRRNFIAAASTLATAGVLWAGLGARPARAGDHPDNNGSTGLRWPPVIPNKCDDDRRITASSPEPASRRLIKKSPSTNFASATWS